MVKHPFEQHNAQGGERNPFPGVVRCPVGRLGFDLLRAHADLVARLDVALFRIEQVDRESLAAALPVSRQTPGRSVSL